MTPMLAVSTSMFITILGLAMGFIGALVIASGPLAFLRSEGDPSTRPRERRRVAIGAFIVAFAFALQLLSEGMKAGGR